MFSQYLAHMGHQLVHIVVRLINIIKYIVSFRHMAYQKLNKTMKGENKNNKPVGLILQNYNIMMQNTLITSSDPNSSPSPHARNSE